MSTNPAIVPSNLEAIGLLRRGLYNLIAVSPGLHFRELQRRTKMATGQLIHHLNYLRKHSIIETTNDGQYLRYYALEEVNKREKKVIELAHRKSIRRILVLLIEKNFINHEEIAKNLNLSPSTVSWHMKKLVNSGVVTKEIKGRRAYFYIGDPEFVLDTLLKHRESFIDKMVDSLADLFDD